jgi:hypothetical protein
MRHRRTRDGKKETGKEHTHNPSSVATAEPGIGKIMRIIVSLSSEIY